MSEVWECVEELNRKWAEIKGPLDQIGQMFEVLVLTGYLDMIIFVDEAITALADEMTAIPSHLRTAADAWGEDGIVTGLRDATVHMQGSEVDDTGYLGLANLWKGESADAAGLLHRALIYAMDSGAATLPAAYDDNASDRDYSGTDDAHIVAWGEVQRGQFMAQVLNDIADELERGILEHVGNIWGAIGAGTSLIGLLTARSAVAAAASALGAVMSWLLAIVGAVVTFIAFAVSVYNSLGAMYAQVAIMAGSRFGGMTSDLPNYGPEWAASGA